ncbi:MAG TPA: hypothetical protein VI383_04830 [Gemmatimonadales bacterium]|nr:hypothetical protein [Gemmatimonadales bacterium]
MKRAPIVAGISFLVACGSGGPTLPPVTLLSPEGANHQSARYSHDGARLYWWETEGPAVQLWSATADLSDPAKLPVTALFPVPPYPSPDGSLLAVLTNEGGLADVAVIPAAGGAPRQLTHERGIAIPFGWNPDGDRLVYLATAAGSGGGTFRSFVTSASRGGSVPLLPGESRPAFGVWSPDGARIGYAVVEGGKLTIWVADSAGGNPRQLTTEGFEELDEMAWSPDGRELVYWSRRTGTSDIWVVPVDGGPLRQLTHDIRNDTGPRWSPDGKWIAFLSDRGRQTDLWVVPAAGGPERRITDDQGSEELLQWRPGTNQLAYLTGLGQSALWSLRLSGGEARRLTPDSIRASGERISPDGKQILFSIDRGGGNSDLALMPVEGGPWRVLVQGGINLLASWSPDGSRILFQSDRGGTQDIWVVGAAAGEPRQLTSWQVAERNPVWNEDGSVIYFLSDRDARLSDVWRVPAVGGEPERVTRHGAVFTVVGYRGRPELFAQALGAGGQYGVSRLNPDGTLSLVWDRSSAFPDQILPGGDSLLIAEVQPGGQFKSRLIPMKGGSEGRTLLNAGEAAGWFSADGGLLTYSIPTGATSDLAVLNRRDGTTRRLTTSPETESGAQFTPDGGTIVFTRSSTVRRIATADLTRLLGGQ